MLNIMYGVILIGVIKILCHNIYKQIQSKMLIKWFFTTIYNDVEFFQTFCTLLVFFESLV